MEKLPIYKLVIEDDETGVNFVALVDFPAIEKNFVAFNKSKPYKFEVQDEEKRILAGPLMIANLPIYRNDNNMGEYYALFDSPTIEKIVQKFFRNNNTHNVNKMHDPNQKVEGVFMYQSFIINRSQGINPPKGFDTLTDGSWFGFYKVENDEVWNDFIKTGELKGFSVEGDFYYEPHKEEPKDVIDEIIETINGML